MKFLFRLQRETLFKFLILCLLLLLMVSLYLNYLFIVEFDVVITELSTKLAQKAPNHQTEKAEKIQVLIDPYNAMDEKNAKVVMLSIVFCIVGYAILKAWWNMQ